MGYHDVCRNKFFWSVITSRERLDSSLHSLQFFENQLALLLKKLKRRKIAFELSEVLQIREELIEQFLIGREKVSPQVFKEAHVYFVSRVKELFPQLT